MSAPSITNALNRVRSLPQLADSLTGDTETKVGHVTAPSRKVAEVMRKRLHKLEEDRTDKKQRSDAGPPSSLTIIEDGAFPVPDGLFSTAATVSPTPTSDARVYPFQKSRKSSEALSKQLKKQPEKPVPSDMDATNVSKELDQTKAPIQTMNAIESDEEIASALEDEKKVEPLQKSELTYANVKKRLEEEMKEGPRGTHCIEITALIPQGSTISDIKDVPISLKPPLTIQPFYLEGEQLPFHKFANEKEEDTTTCKSTQVQCRYHECDIGICNTISLFKLIRIINENKRFKNAFSDLKETAEVIEVQTPL